MAIINKRPPHTPKWICALVGNKSFFWKSSLCLQIYAGSVLPQMPQETSHILQTEYH